MELPKGQRAFAVLNGSVRIAGRKRSPSAHYLRHLARFAKPGFSGEPFVINLADRAVGARKEHRTASKLLPVRFDARRDSASRLRAFDHDDAHPGLPPCFAFLSQRHAIGWTAPLAGGACSSRSRRPAKVRVRR